MKNCVYAVILTVAGLACAACGSEAHLAAAPTPGSTAQALAAAGGKLQPFLHEIAFGEEQEGTAGRSPECLLLRSKIQTRKLMLKAGSDWRNLKRTDAWGRLAKDRAAFVDAGCSHKTDKPTEQCLLLDEHTRQAWDAVLGTPEWQVLTKNSLFEPLLTDYQHAQDFDCYKP